MSINGNCTFSNQSVPNTNRFYFSILDTGATNTIRNIFLWIYGKQLGNVAIAQHGEPGVGNHVHTPGGAGSGATTGAGGAHSHSAQGMATTDVPQNVKIIIDGTDRTAAIGNPNAKPSSMYNSTSDYWGNSTGVEWDTGQLDITSYVDLTVEEHYIEFQENDGEGGKLLFNLYLA